MCSSTPATFLETRPIEHNLVLTILHDRVANPEPGRYWWVTDDHAVVGVALQSPTTFFATLTPMTRSAVLTLAETISDTVPDLPGINGEAGTSAAFAGHWAEIRRTPATPDIGMRLYRLGELRMAGEPSGRARVAAIDDHELSVSWIQGFNSDTGEPALIGPDLQMKALIAEAPVWDDDPGRLPRGYTARTRSADAVRDILDHHADGCVLYTALANPTSNAIYRSLGYEAVAEVLRYRFG